MRSELIKHVAPTGLLFLFFENALVC